MPNVTRCLIIGGVLLTLASFGAFAQTTDLDCDGCVDSDDIANSSIRASDIRKKAILKHHIAPLAVNENKIADGAVSLDKLAPEVTDLIESLSARVDELEAQNIGINGGDFTGRKYCLHGYGREQTGGNNAGIYYAHYRAVVRFTSPTQVSVKDLGEVEAFLQIPSPHGNATETSGASPSEIYPYVVIGNIMTINLGSEDGEQDYFISPDGNFLFNGWSGLEDGGNTQTAEMQIAIRADSC